MNEFAIHHIYHSLIRIINIYYIRVTFYRRLIKKTDPRMCLIVCADEQAKFFISISFDHENHNYEIMIYVIFMLY